MNCPECNAKTEIHETRLRGDSVKRHRYCCQCKAKFITSETFERKVKQRIKKQKTDFPLQGIWNVTSTAG